jgi:5-methyltetrahydropteroyltriglutamate--homocysteine methyltransferase
MYRSDAVGSLSRRKGTIVLGRVRSNRLALESKEELKRRIHEAERFLPLERLALSPQCGFASTWEGNLVTEADQEAKLRLVAETAREVWEKPATPCLRTSRGNPPN